MRSRWFPGISVVLTAFFVVSVAWQSQQQVSAFGSDPANPGVMAGPGPDPTQPISERWRIGEEGDRPEGDAKTAETMSTGVSVENGVVYFGTMDGAVQAAELQTGTILWSVSLSDLPFRGTPAVADGTLYIADFQQQLFALDTSDGTLRWTFETGEPLDSYGSFDTIFPSPIAADGMVYFGGWDGVVHALDAAEGAETWQSTFAEPILVAPTVSDGVLVAGDRGGTLRGFDAATGEERWQSTNDAAVNSALAAVDGVLYWKYDRGVMAFDLQRGDLLWDAPLEYPRASEFSGVAVVDGVVVFGHNSNLLAMSAQGTGEILWTYENGRSFEPMTSPPTVADGVVYVACQYWRFCGIDLATGEELWHASMDNPALAPAAVADELVVFGTGSFTIVAFGGPSDEMLSATEAADAAIATATAEVGLAITATADIRATEQAQVMETATAQAGAAQTAQAEADLAWTATAEARATEQAYANVTATAYTELMVTEEAAAAYLATMDAEVAATEQVIRNATETVQAEIRATEQAYEASWEAYFGAIGEAMAGSESLPPSMSIGDLDVEIETNEETGEQAVFASYRAPISGADVESNVAVMIAPSEDAAIEEMEIWRDSVVRSGWEVTDGPDLGDESGCATLIEDGSAIASCIYRDGDMLVAAGSEVPTESRDAALLNANDLLAVFAEAHESVGDPDA